MKDKNCYIDVVEIEKLKKSTFKSENLFVVSSLGQLQKMQALIRKTGLEKNVLVFLYNYKQIKIANDIQKHISGSLFTDVIFVKIPHGLQKPNLKKNMRLNKIYKKVLSFSKFKSLYVNGFDGYHNIILSLAKSKKIKLVFVEDNISIYSIKDSVYSHGVVSEDSIKKYFKNTVSQSELAKKIARFKKEYKNSHSLKSAWSKAAWSVKDFKLIKQVYGLFGTFVKQVWNSAKIQSKAINVYKRMFPVISYSPFLTFDEAYVSYPKKLENTFKNTKIKQFLFFHNFDEDEFLYAKNSIEKYNIVSKDVLFISQDNECDLRLYMREIYFILSNLAIGRRVFIKLHSTESEIIQRMYNRMSEMSEGRIVLLDSYISPELLISISPIDTVIGLTSNSLISLNLMKPDLKIISIAKLIKNKLSWSDSCKVGIEQLSRELEVLEDVKQVVFLDDSFMESVCAK